MEPTTCWNIHAIVQIDGMIKWWRGYAFYAWSTECLVRNVNTCFSILLKQLMWLTLYATNDGKEWRVARRQYHDARSQGPESI